MHVMLDRDLETRIPNQAVKRNGERFPSDLNYFMFQLTEHEFQN